MGILQCRGIQGNFNILTFIYTESETNVLGLK
jgi:hypothetical protein